MTDRDSLPKIISVEPNRIIPWHDILNPNYSIYLDYINDVSVPPIPVMHAPEELKHIGDYVNYNGHHRTQAAIAAQKFPNLILLETWEDICYLRDNPPRFRDEIYPEFQEYLDDTFEAHRDFIWNEVRRFYRFNQIAKQKGIKRTIPTRLSLVR